MPPKSKAQARFMRAAAAGKVPGVSRKVGREYTEGYPTKGLPEKKRAAKSRKR